MSYLAPYKKSVVIAVAFMLLDVVCEVIQPTLMSNIVGFGIQSGDIPYIVGTGSLMILFALMRAIPQKLALALQPDCGAGCLRRSSNFRLKTSTPFQPPHLRRV